MILKSTLASVAVGILMLTTASGVATARGNHGDHGALLSNGDNASTIYRNAHSGSGAIALVQPGLSESRSGFIDRPTFIVPRLVGPNPCLPDHFHSVMDSFGDWETVAQSPADCGPEEAEPVWGSGIPSAAPLGFRCFQAGN